MELVAVVALLDELPLELLEELELPEEEELLLLEELELVLGHFFLNPGGNRTGWWSRSHGGFVVPFVVSPVPFVPLPVVFPPLHCLCLARNGGWKAW